MLTEIGHTLRRRRGAIIGWGIGLALYAFMMVSLYGSVAQMGNIEQFLESYPEEMLSFFPQLTALTTPAGYLDTYYFNYMTVIAGILAVSLGSGLLVGDEEQGVLDLVLAHPISRTALFWGRWVGMALVLIGALIVAWLGWVLPAGNSDLALTWLELALPFIPLFAVLLLFGTLALLLSMLLPSGRMAGMLAGALLVANYLLVGLSNVDEDLEPVVRYTPLYEYPGGTAIDGLDAGWLAILLAASVGIGLAAWALFRRRDIRVGGERSWSWESLAFWR
jgi:ABC-2 type transport system permease protein